MKEQNRLIRWIKNEWEDTKDLLRSIPALPYVFFVISIVCMNLLASKALVNESWIALDAGILVSWLSFLSMDMLVRRFGPKASIKLSILASLLNIIVMAVFMAAAFIPGDWGLNDYAMKESWWIIGASTAAFIVSGVVNAILNWLIRKAFKKNPDGKLAYVASAYGSTFVGQFIDNLVFALVFTFPASLIGLWGMEPMTILALFMFALTGAVVELICEIIFSPIGYHVSQKWARDGIGQDYINKLEIEKKLREQRKIRKELLNK